MPARSSRPATTSAYSWISNPTTFTSTLAARTRAEEPRQVRLTHLAEPRIGQADGVEHAAAKLGHARRTVARPRLERDGLGHQPAERIEVHHPVELATVSGRPRCEQQRILEADPEYVGATAWKRPSFQLAGIAGARLGRTRRRGDPLGP